MKCTNQCIKEKFLIKELYVLQYYNTKKVEIFYVLHDKVALLMKRFSERGTRNCP